jgi:signal transduction histidine kinase
LLFLNISENKSFVKFLLHGVHSNKDAIGTKVWLYPDLPGKQKHLAGYRELNGGGGYASLSAKEMIFGVSQGTVYYALVKFPSSRDTLRIDRIVAGKTLEISELTGLRALLVESKNRVVRFFTDQEKQPEIIKFLLIILLMIVYNLRLRKSVRKIIVFRWLSSGLIFLAFIFVNGFFLFSGFTPSYFIAPVIVLGLLAILHLFIGRILLRRMAQTEKLDLREKLSRDLHDDLASTLGSISIYSETLKGMNEPSPAAFKKLSVKIAGLTQSALESIADIIWMTSPRNDSLQSLISKTSNYMLEILTDNKINFRSAIDIPDDPVIVEEKIRNDSFLILKEGLHNIIKHSGAHNVIFSAQILGNNCKISLKDDGIGLGAATVVKKGSHGNGLINMRRRAQESGIEFSIHSESDSGTEIVIQFRI